MTEWAILIQLLDKEIKMIMCTITDWAKVGERGGEQEVWTAEVGNCRWVDVCAAGMSDTPQERLTFF